MLRLMTFPDDYQLVGDRSSIQRQLGNAVPVALGKIVITALLTQLGHIEPREDNALSRQLELV
jgi:DNA (cytosine-5)-methyltransferase 1